jgi:hypothetical protein
MIVFARGSITNRDALAPHREELRAVAQLKADGLTKAAYRRTAEPGVYLVLERSSVDAVAERVNALPFPQLATEQSGGTRVTTAPQPRVAPTCVPTHSHCCSDPKQTP